MALTREKTDVRREQIAKAALDVVGLEGVKGLTTARIARFVGVSEANLYRHFKNKEAIVHAVVEAIEAGLLAIIRKHARPGVHAVKRLERVFLGELSYLQQNRGMPRILTSSEILFSNELREKWRDTMSRFVEGIAGILRQGFEDGSVDRRQDPEASAVIFLGMMQVSALRWLFSEFRLDLNAQGRRLWKEYKRHVETGNNAEPSLRRVKGGRK
jgi:AcrR family transcriptional regulator